jgi:hypothetical protein
LNNFTKLKLHFGEGTSYGQLKPYHSKITRLHLAHLYLSSNFFNSPDHISEDILQLFDTGKLSVLKLTRELSMSKETLIKIIEKVGEGVRFKFKGYVNGKRQPKDQDSRRDKERGYVIADEFESSFVDKII